MSIPLRPLGLIKNLVEAMGLDISYMYDDLIFIEHNAFLLQMSEADGAEVWVWFNEESTPDDRPTILTKLRTEGGKLLLQVQDKGTFSLSGQDDGESFQLRFSPRE